jgi:hypothetical protein
MYITAHCTVLIQALRLQVAGLLYKKTQISYLVHMAHFSNIVKSLENQIILKAYIACKSKGLNRRAKINRSKQASQNQ